MLQHIVNRFSYAAKNFGLTISLKNTEVLYQPPPREAYSPHISIDVTNLNAVERFTYLGSVISNDGTVSKDLDNRLSKASTSYERLSKRVWQSHSLRLSSRPRYTEPSLFPRCTVQRPGFSTGSRSGYLSRFINAVYAPLLASNGKATCQTKKSSRKPACPA